MFECGFYSLHLRSLPDPRNAYAIGTYCEIYRCGSVQGSSAFRKVDLFRVQKHSTTILSFVLHVCAFISIVVACAYTATALALPFTWGAMAGAIFYLVLLLVIWD